MGIIRTHRRPDTPIDVRGSGNLLVVDDEAMVRNLAKFALERCGYTVELAQNGQEALNAFAARPDAFAAVILDLTMPVMAGEEALDRLWQLRADIPVPLSSGFSEEEALKGWERAYRVSCRSRTRPPRRLSGASH